MKAVIDIPEPIARRIGALAERNGQDVTAQIVQVLDLVLATDDAVAEWASVLRASDAGNVPVFVLKQKDGTITLIHVRQQGKRLPDPVFSADPVTGLPVIHSPPDAPIHQMTGEQFQAMVNAIEEEAELERAGIPL